MVYKIEVCWVVIVYVWDGNDLVVDGLWNN